MSIFLESNTKFAASASHGLTEAFALDILFFYCRRLCLETCFFEGKKMGFWVGIKCVKSVKSAGDEERWIERDFISISEVAQRLYMQAPVSACNCILT